MLSQTRTLFYGSPSTFHNSFHPLGNGFAIFCEYPRRLLGTGLRRMAGNAATHQSPSSFLFDLVPRQRRGTQLRTRFVRIDESNPLCLASVKAVSLPLASALRKARLQSGRPACT